MVPSLPGHENVNPKRQRWSHLHSQITEKITTLKKVKENHQSQNREDAENRQKVREQENNHSVLESVVFSQTA